MHVAAHARLVLARHPWLYWTAVAALAALLAAIVHAQTAQLDDARRAWGRTLPVLVATGPLKPGDTIEAHTVDVPVALVPTDALQALPDGARLRQRVAGGDSLIKRLITLQRAGTLLDKLFAFCFLFSF